MAKDKALTDAQKIVTPIFRASYPHIFKPSKIEGAKNESYSIEMLFNKEQTDLKPFQKAIHAACVAKWGPDKSEWPEGLKSPIKDGDKPQGKKKELRPEAKGCWIIRASTSAEYSKPYVVGRDSTQPIINESEFYAGCFARAALKAHAYSFADKDGIKFILDGVQKVKDGQAFGGRKPAHEVFGALDFDVDEPEFLTDDSDSDQESFL